MRKERRILVVLVVIFPTREIWRVTTETIGRRVKWMTAEDDEACRLHWLLRHDEGKDLTLVMVYTIRVLASLYRGRRRITTIEDYVWTVLTTIWHGDNVEDEENVKSGDRIVRTHKYIAKATNTKYKQMQYYIMIILQERVTFLGLTAKYWIAGANNRL